MKTLLRLGPADHGRPITLEEFEHASGEEGYNYELIRGRVYVSPKPNPSHDYFLAWLGTSLRKYAWDHPQVVNYISQAARTFVPQEEAPEISAPDPDRALYAHYSLAARTLDPRCERDDAYLVVEVVSDDPEKDHVPNADLDLPLRSIKEYWVLDARDPEQPVLPAYQRHGRRWRIRTLH